MITHTDRFLRACRREPVDCTPVWFMRQAGRYMPEYRALRRRYALLELCKTPELAAEVTLQPIHRLPVDAAIIFTDLLIPLEPMGVKLVFAPNEGPVIENPIRCAADVQA
ncbi:MAG: uroporphyrinogen decarboxylase, partial [Candidatus Tectomicrobia bacterium]|nr:uroporphyrinogen decarboxylase [Candidatus Tectomicrobia bacterium]